MNENRAVAVRQQPGPLWNGRAKDFGEAKQIAFIVGASGIFPDAADQNAAFVKILVGASLGISPAAALQHIKVFDGTLNVGAHLLAARIKASGRYDFEVVRCDDEECHCRFVKLVGTQWVAAGPDIRLTMEDAKKKGWNLSKKGNELPAWTTNADDMLFVSVIKRAYKRYFPDLSADVPLGGDEDDGGEMAVSPQAAAMLAASQPAEAPGAAGEIVDAEFTVTPPVAANSEDTPTPADPFDAIAQRLDRLNDLARDCAITPEQLKKQLLKYGTDNIHKLTPDNLDDLEKKLNALKAKKLNGQPAPQPVNAT